MCRFYVCAALGFSFIPVFVLVSGFFARILICKFIGIVQGWLVKMGHIAGIRGFWHSGVPQLICALIFALMDLGRNMKDWVGIKAHSRPFELSVTT